jgi:hypothetical protein
VILHYIRLKQLVVTYSTSTYKQLITGMYICVYFASHYYIILLDRSVQLIFENTAIISPSLISCHTSILSIRVGFLLNTE